MPGRALPALIVSETERHGVLGQFPSWEGLGVGQPQ